MWLHMSFSDLSMAQLSLYCKWMEASAMAAQVDQTNFMERNQTAACQSFLWKRGAPSGLPSSSASEGLVQLVNLHKLACTWGVLLVACLGDPTA